MHISPLDSVHRQRGARLTEFGGWELPLRYGSELAEHEAVRQRAGLFDLSHMAKFDLVGPGAGAGLDRALTAWHSTMEVGRAAYSLLLANDGGVIDDLIVYRLAAEHYLVIANAANHGVDWAELSARLSPYQAALTDLTFDNALIAVQGPVAVAVMTAAGVGDLSGLRYYAARPDQLAGGPVLICRTGYTGEDGFEIMVPAAQAETVWTLLERAGQDLGLTLCGLACRDTLRLEAGMPLYGHELTRATTPWEAGLKRYVALDKDDFVGRTALADEAEQTPRSHLIGLRGSGRRAARAGYRVCAADGRPVGGVTSGALSPTLGYPIALAYVTGPKPAPGDQLTVDVRGELLPVEVTPTPFYRRPRPAAPASSQS
ncbi:MAG: glycine cleavage system aminomethyltransferase GcvT [Propionibacteriaceae bacterium]|jgi:aminomethyltransferase|nr:glycine cleavage system aminomethyltransferase GcvT [Propionibacteriaceae bacterium]